MTLDQPRRFYFLSHPRSASNLLVRLLGIEQQPNVAQRWMNGYFFHDVVLLTEKLGIQHKHIRDWAEDERTQTRQCFQECFDKVEAHLCQAEKEGKITFIKEHSYVILDPVYQSKFHFGADSVSEPEWVVNIPERYGTNPTKSEGNITVLPDQFLDTWKPIFLIRHPALMFPSFYRALGDISKLEGTDFSADKEEVRRPLDLRMSLYCPRTLYDWYAKRLGKTGDSANQGDAWPIVVDADDVINSPEIVVKLGDMMGLDRDRLQFTWGETKVETHGDLFGKRAERMLDTLPSSNGIIKEKAAVNLDIDVEAKKWREEFGERMGQTMEGWVRAAMPDYEYLKERKLKATQS
ncbi:hypothetical protein PRK78_003591 [Emydomyces testavorans]|uniref:Sulfotransferase domain-containing protein n=1 Tax=Emydomyces testavorans TaxID=2070801 RepID=A0AAF0IKR1_9EURO|nr:hypothetical protein PRK78_003591 [Emydomyces testavorans]